MKSRTRLRPNEERWYGDIGVSVVGAQVDTFQSISPSGRFLLHDPAFVVILTLKNRNPNRINSVPGQTGLCSLRDDVGNTYRELNAKTEIGLSSNIHGQIAGAALQLRSEKPGKDCVVFEKPVAGASRVVLLLSEKPYGGSGEMRLTIPLKKK